MLNEAGLITGIITGEKSPIVTARGAKIKAAEVHLGVLDKLTHVSRLAQKYGLSLNQVAYVGDDTNDLALMLPPAPPMLSPISGPAPITYPHSGVERGLCAMLPNTSLKIHTNSNKKNLTSGAFLLSNGG